MVATVVLYYLLALHLALVHVALRGERHQVQVAGVLDVAVHARLIVCGDVSLVRDAIPVGANVGSISAGVTILV